MVNRKAYLRTLEVVFAILLTMSVLVFVFSGSKVPSDGVFSNIDVLGNLEFNPEFRGCVVDGNQSCVVGMVNNSLPALYRSSFSVAVTDDINYIPEDLPDKRVYANSVFIVGDVYNYSPKIVKLFYW